MALLFTLLCGGSVIILGYFSYYFTRGHFIHGTEAVIDTEIKYITSLENPQNINADDSRLYAFFSQQDSRPEVIPESISLLSEGIILFDHMENHKRYAAKVHTFDDGNKVLVGVDITEVESDYNLLRWLSILCIGFMIIVIVVSYLISFFVVGGTNQIANTAGEIMDTGDLSRRVEVTSRWDDLGNMTIVLNTLLARIEQLMQGMRQVSDNIAHDLRTPLTRMKNHIEDLKKEGDNPAYDELTEEADQILATFNALLKISRIESEKQRSQFSKVDLQKLMNDLVAFYEPLAEEKQISVLVDLDEVYLNGDRRLLFQALANLLDNAIKFTPSGGCIKLGLCQSNKLVHIWIEDSGAGIADEERVKVFNRFYRGEKSRGSPGTGLGLSLVAAVVKLHKGNTRLEDNNPGLRVCIDLAT